MTGNTSAARELWFKTMERIISLLQEVNSTWSMAKDVPRQQCLKVEEDVKLKAIRLENRRFTTKEMKNKWAETGVTEL